ncbi:MAG: GNAT family N-acetyltransferase [Planctomycetes bacterium]|nr:GNAT family N-acetyltransferase [Planctomycetota bacterium]
MHRREPIRNRDRCEVGPRMADVKRAHSENDLAEVAELFREYAAWLALEKSSCRIEKTISEFPGQYGPPDGCLLLARQDDRPVGCVALRRFDDDTCEMKRLHVRPAHRGRGIGKALATEIIDEARRLGYHKMRLDSIADRMAEAVSLYRALGFREIPPYGDHPEGCTLFMELDL